VNNKKRKVYEMNSVLKYGMGRYVVMKGRMFGLQGGIPSKRKNIHKSWGCSSVV
jgi:hypothetical protein